MVLGCGGGIPSASLDHAWAAGAGAALTGFVDLLVLSLSVNIQRRMRRIWQQPVTFFACCSVCIRPKVDLVVE